MRPNNNREGKGLRAAHCQRGISRQLDIKRPDATARRRASGGTAELLATTKNPTRDQIVTHMDGNICRCGTYPRIMRAIERAAREA